MNQRKGEISESFKSENIPKISDDLTEGKDAPHALVDGIDEPAAVPFPAELLHLVLALLEKVKLGKLLVVQVRLTFHELTLVESPAY